MFISGNAAMEKISVADFVQNVEAYLKRIAERGERFVLEQGHAPVAEISPVAASEHRRAGELPELFESLPRLSGKEAESFARDLEEARRLQERKSLRDPWRS